MKTKAFLILVFFTVTAAAQTPLQIKVHTASPAGFLVTSTLISGEKDAVLIDAQFTQSDAHRLAAALLESGKNLGIIYITHFHPDHYFGLNVLKQAFPNVKIVALPVTIEEIKGSWEGKVKQWGPMYGNNLTSTPIVPEPLDGTSINLEGETIQIVGDVQGDARHNSYIWVPSLKTVICGDVVYSGVYPWTLETNRAQRKEWIKALDKVAAMKPVAVVAGHKKPEMKDDLSAVDFTRQYLVFYDTALASSKTSDEFMNKVKAKFPALDLEIILKLAADAAFSKKK